MSDRVFVGTRKGLFDIRREAAGGWAVARTAFLGSPVSYVLRDFRDGAVYAALDLGHFGVKLHRSDDDGASGRSSMRRPTPASVRVTPRRR